MTPLAITSELVGRKVAVPTRPEWGTGTVLRVQSTTVDGAARHRVSVQFPLGLRTLQVPPAVLVEPRVEPERAAGWLDTVAGRTLDDRLSALPAEITEHLGTPASRVRVIAALYEVDGDDPKSLARWAKRQTNVGDPLSHWTRDELGAAFERFVSERDAVLRGAAAQLRMSEGPAAVDALLAEFEPAVRQRMLAALRKII